MSRVPAGNGRRPDKAPSRRGFRGAGIAALLALSTVVAVVGLVQAGLISRGAAAGPAEPQAGLDGLQAAVTGAQWLDHAHADPIPASGNGTAAAVGDPAGYQMPAQMMPGMPAEGQTRLLVRMNLANDNDAARAVDPAVEFVLRDERGGHWPAEGDTFGGFTRLNPRNGVTGGVFFDVPNERVAQQGWVLEWTRDGRTTRLAVSLGTPAHSH
ncbi:MAG TPA: hypothetical protein VMU51_21755 [Mycobacteriales bacterium]|nr:hypothetical protein [Mycobacteriales bacterium]